jgi:hypothetical protein
LFKQNSLFLKDCDNPAMAETSLELAEEVRQN